ncbi:MAG: amidohydrolase [Gammaproteobacteria bacterium]|nr:MAG: amidohydrolase [Gammaproteobacteria bacterium]
MAQTAAEGPTLATHIFLRQWPVWLGLACLLAIAGCGERVPDKADTVELHADTLYVGRHILTMDAATGPVTAVAVAGETIAWVGDRDAWRGHADEVVELGERALLPGFIDAHGHLSFMARTLGLANLAPPPVGGVTDLASLKQVMIDYIAAHDVAAGAWVVGFGYDDSLINERRHPDRDDLDAVSTEHPIALVHVSGHLMATNSAALREAGITAETPDPPGGVIRRRSDSDEPNGVLEETAMGPLTGLFLGDGGLTAEAIEAALDEYARFGVTTVQDSAASWQLHTLLAAIAADTGLKLDVLLFPVGMDGNFDLPEGVELGRYRDRLQVAGTKLMLDGSPQGKTAYLSEPYHVVPEGLPDDYRGYPVMTNNRAKALIRDYLGRGIPMQIHANGDAAADMLINGVAAAVADAPVDNHRTVMIHAQTVREDQLDRMQTLGIIPSFFAAHVFYWGDWHRDSVLGPERAANISPTASSFELGLPFTLHNDAPIVPPDMLRLLWAATHRETRSGRILGEAQRIPVLEALRAVTINAAHQSFEEERKGTLTPGKQADLVVLSANPLDTAPEALLELEVLRTVSRGVTVYDAERATP